MRPQPPRDVRAGKVGPSWIELCWEPPILDGGAAVCEYEVAYSVVSKVRVGKQVERSRHPLPAQRTTAYALKQPVFDSGFTLVELCGGTEYAGLAVRCRNSVGWSAFGEQVASVTTRPSVRPSRPLFLEAGAVSSTTVPLRWAPPLGDGGADVVDYLVSHRRVSRQSLTIERMTRLEEFSRERERERETQGRRIDELEVRS